MQRHIVIACSVCGVVLVLLLSAGVADSSATPAAGSSSSNPAVIPFEIRRGHIMVPATVNGTNKLSLLLDTGYGMTMLRLDHVEEFALNRTGRSISIVGIAGEEQAALYEGPTFEFAGASWKPRRVASFPAANQSRSRRREGVLGSGFFRRFVVEIDPWRKELTLHDPDAYSHSGSGEILPLTFKNSTPIVEASVRLAGGSTIKAQFEIDTGCDSALCIGKHFVEAHDLLPSDRSSDGGRVGVGGSTSIKTGHLIQLQLGQLTIEKPPANFFLDGSPADAPLAGHIGWELLRDFKIVFDYSRKRMILKSKD